jgi:hypothetical protein
MDDRFERAIARIDAANGEDPNHERWQGQEFPRELLYGRRMSEWLARAAPDASEPLRLAARAQHLQRWKIPRERYPMTREGYLKWRKELYAFHAETAAALLGEVGYDAATIDRVRELVSKKEIRRDPEGQLLEDVVCLVFLEFYFADFSARHDEEKIVTIVKKTWRKMSPRGRDLAMGLKLPPGARRLIGLALA